MILYAETSAVLSWLLEEDGTAAVETALTTAELVVTSDLTLLETERALVRAVATGRLDATSAASARDRVQAVSRFWLRLRLTGGVLERARAPFPAEPVRTLDALHLASAFDAREEIVGLVMLSLDARIRRNAADAEMPVVP